MIKLLVGAKGSGKTKTLIEMVNTKAKESKGAVICVEKGDKLKLDITYQARLIDSDAYMIQNANDLYGFIAGILASNSDITDLFIDSALKIAQNDVAAFDLYLEKLEKIAADTTIVMTVSLPIEAATDTMKKYI